MEIFLVIRACQEIVQRKTIYEFLKGRTTGLRIKDITLGHMCSSVSNSLNNLIFNIPFVLSTFPVLRVIRTDASNISPFSITLLINGLHPSLTSVLRGC